MNLLGAIELPASLLLEASVLHQPGPASGCLMKKDGTCCCAHPGCPAVPPSCPPPTRATCGKCWNSSDRGMGVAPAPPPAAVKITATSWCVNVLDRARPDRGQVEG